METLRVKVPTKRAKALLVQLQELGVIEIEDNGASLEALTTTMRRIRSSVKEKLTVKEVMSEVDAVRAKRHAVSRKA